MGQFDNEDDENQQPNIRDYLTKKYKIGGDAAGYKAVADDTADVDAASSRGAKANMALGIMGALSGAYGKDDSQFFDARKKEVNATVDKAEESHAARVKNYLTQKELGQNEMKAAQADEKFGIEFEENSRLNTPNSRTGRG